MFFHKQGSTLALIFEIGAIVVLILGLALVNIYFAYMSSLHFKPQKVDEEVPKPTKIARSK